MLTISTVSTQKFAIPRISLFILAASVFAGFLSLVPASYPANVPAGVKNAKVVGHSTPAHAIATRPISQNR